ncbi:helicase [Companilactobacillus mindensis DSM 14500]|uniref:Helicase n=1 Tax=Companilactobacillus mindensis DSM 14500 TaxID=1423770 RepID=A0A0R1QK02_9LACO|nr:DEAD/DEAH box helicase [Companilactobacillus mindensis]KRL44833.1 helicase [Companilactobacillus mindensis DSM 14500]GEO79633.1 helicase [Companilactobacillus mindensis]
MNIDDEIRNGLNFGFIDNSTQALTRYQPSLVTNNNGTVLDTLEEELCNTDSFTIAVAFVTLGGLLDLKSTLTDIAAHGVHGRLITSTYLNFNSPKVFDDLLHIPNLEVRVLNQNGFHTKAYYFNHGNYESLLVGSSNLTQNALKKNFEWNLRITSTERGDIINKVKDELENLWQQSIPLTTKWIEDYRQNWQPPTTTPQLSKNIARSNPIIPNKMQKSALESLRHLRDAEHAKKGLIVAATGTGKTYLAAFDVQQFKPKRLLFVVHREQILRKAMQSFKEILGGPDSDYGILSGNQKELSARYLFATVNMVSKKSVCEQLGESAFDYIIIDEAHRVGQNQLGKKESMYQRLMNFYKPQFMLGMTATPERTDGTNVYAYFDHNLAYEISLLDALDHEFLTPFHYIGVTDYEKDGESITDKTSLKHLVSDERVNYIVAKTEYYGPRNHDVHGLIFVSRIEEGRELANKLKERNIDTIFVSASDTVETRENAVHQLNNGDLQYIITVDIFNEGVDIPIVNQIIMMRPTKSSIIFLQQLGRGLRKAPHKEFVTILDFIGNYDENYMIPMAFDRSNTSNKEKIRKQVISPSISGVSTINFEEIARNHILESVSKVRLNDMKRFKNAYQNLKDKIGLRSPMLLDFAKMGSVDVPDIIQKFKTSYAMQHKFEQELPESLNDKQQLFLTFVSEEITVSKRPIEAWILKQLLNKQTLTDEDILSRLKEQNIFCDKETIDNVASILNLNYFAKGKRKKYGNVALIERNNSIWKFTDKLQSLLQSQVFKKYFVDALDANLWNLHQNPTMYHTRFTIGEKYYRSDVIKMLNWEKEPNYLSVGGYSLRQDNRFLPIFISLKKNDKFQNKMIYDNTFFDRSTLPWFSKGGRTTSSTTEQKILNLKKFGIIQLFVRKYNDDKLEGTDFYYLGSARVLNAKDIVEENVDGKPTKLVDFTLRLEHEVDSGLYRVLTED